MRAPGGLRRRPTICSRVGAAGFSYTSLRRFIVRRGWQRRSPATVRMGESAPGEVAEMDFGRLGLMEDPETGRRRIYCIARMLDWESNVLGLSGGNL